MNKFFDRYQIRQDTSFLIGGFYFGMSIPFTVASFALMYDQRDMNEALKMAKRGEIIDADGENMYEIGQIYNNKPIIIKGYAISSSTLKENGGNVKQALGNIPHKVRVAESSRDNTKTVYPREIVSEHKTVTNNFYQVQSSDFNVGLRGKVLVKGGIMTTFENFHYKRLNEPTYYSKLVSKIPNIIHLDLNHFNSLKWILVEGEMVTIAGILKYNSSLNEFQITRPFSIIAGESPTMIRRGLERAAYNFKSFGVAGITVALLSALFFYGEYRREIFIRGVREDGQLQLNDPKYDNTEKGFIGNYYIRTVILTPCYHKALCRDCARRYDYGPTCGWNSKFNGFIEMQVQDN